MLFLFLWLMGIGALLWFGSNPIAELFAENARSNRQANRDLAASLGLADDQRFDDEAEMDALLQAQCRLLARIAGIVAFNLGVLGIIFL